MLNTDMMDEVTCEIEGYFMLSTDMMDKVTDMIDEVTCEIEEYFSAHLIIPLSDAEAIVLRECPKIDIW